MNENLKETIISLFRSQLIYTSGLWVWFDLTWFVSLILKFKGYFWVTSLSKFETINTFYEIFQQFLPPPSLFFFSVKLCITSDINWSVLQNKITRNKDFSDKTLKISLINTWNLFGLKNIALHYSQRGRTKTFISKTRILSHNFDTDGNFWGKIDLKIKDTV